MDVATSKKGLNVSKIKRNAKTHAVRRHFLPHFYFWLVLILTAQFFVVYFHFWRLLMFSIVFRFSMFDCAFDCLLTAQFFVLHFHFDSFWFSLSLAILSVTYLLAAYFFVVTIAYLLTTYFFVLHYHFFDSFWTPVSLVL